MKNELGTISTARQRTNNASRPGKRILANAYPASEQNKSCPITVIAEVITVFPYIWKNGILSFNVVYALVTHCFGKNVGGMETASICVLNDVSSIQKNGASVITQPVIKTT